MHGRYSQWVTLQQIRTLLAIVEFGSFRRAARELGVSQAGLTTSLQALEEALKLTLIVRSAHGIALTPEGRVVHERAQSMDREARLILSDAQRMRGKVGGSLTVGMGFTPTATLLDRVVPDFHTRFPEVQLKLTNGVYEHLEPHLQQGRVELAITAVPDGALAPNLTSTVLFQSELAVVAREDHPSVNARSLSQLTATEWVLLGSPGGPGGSIARYCQESGLPEPRVAATCESLTQLAALVRGTDWMAMVPAVLLEKGLLGVGLSALHLQEPAPRFANCLVQRREPPLSPAAQAFAAMCQSCARAMSPRPNA